MTFSTGNCFPAIIGCAILAYMIDNTLKMDDEVKVRQNGIGCFGRDLTPPAPLPWEGRGEVDEPTFCL